MPMCVVSSSLHKYIKFREEKKVIISISIAISYTFALLVSYTNFDYARV
jgi:hypothetical protein